MKLKTLLSMKNIVLAVATLSMIATACVGGDRGLQTTIYSEGLQFNEGSVPYGSTLLISNFGTEALNPLNTEGKGYIAQLKGDEITTFIAPEGNLSAPKGMAIKDDYLYVADVAKVVIYNLKERGSSPLVLDMPEGNLFVNDIAISGNDAYISVTNSGKIFKLNIASPAEITADDLTPYADIVGANGLVIDGESIYIASYPADGVTTKDNVIYKIEDIKAPVPTKFIERKGQYDGLAMSGDRLYFTNWIDGEFGYVELETKEVVIENLGEGVAFAGPADMSLLDGVIYLPDLPNSRLVKIEL